MIWEVSDEGRIHVVLETERNALGKTPQVMVNEYVTSVAADFNRVGLTLLRDEYRIRQHVGLERVLIFWTAYVPPEQVDQARDYLATLADSHAGG